MTSEGMQLTVMGAEKRDAGRGVARLPEQARSRLSVLSGDTVLIEGERTTVAKVWPAGPDTPSGNVRIDADTRRNAGVSIGDVVTVTPKDVEDASAVTLRPPRRLSDDEREAVERVVKRDLRDRPVGEGEHIHIERLGSGAFVITTVSPDGVVRISRDTNVTVLPGSDEPDSEPAEPEKPATGITYEDIGGLDEELEQVREMIELPLSHPDLFRRAGIDPPKGVLLHGPPGTGKTLIAKAVANEVEAGFITVSGPEIMSKYKGESEERLREIFKEARATAPTIIYFDEIDAIAEKREDSGDAEGRIVAQLLSLMDGLDARGDVIVIASTNRVNAIDPALRRGGRFDREIEIGVPNEKGRREILQVHTRRMPLADDVDLDRLAARTHGFVGADIDSLATEAGMSALRRIRPILDKDGGDDEELEITRDDFEVAMAAVEPSAMREYVAETPHVSFDEIGGLAEAKDALREAVEWPLTYGALFEAAKTEPPSGVLLYGPPGTGKTMLARAIASESEVNFIHVAGPEVLDRYVGESEKAVREVFDRARQAAPSIVFFDEIDAIASQRGPNTHEVTERVVSQLLTELDGMADNPSVVVLAATNRKEVLDRALLRPGRLEQHILVPEPDREARREILAVHTVGKPLGDDVDLDALAEELEGYTGADIDSLVRNASMRAIRELAEGIPPEEAIGRAGEITITMDHFDKALRAVKPSNE